MNRPDTMRVTFDQNPEFSELVQSNDLRAGSPVEFEVKGRVKSVDPEGLDIVIDACVPEGYEIDEEQEVKGMTMGPSQEVAMTPAAMSVRRRK